jgi:putative membrane protein
MIRTFLLQALASGLAVFVGSKLVPNVRVRRNTTAIGVALVFAVLNVVLGWLLKAVLAVVLLPAAILTLGLPYLFLGLLVNTILLWATDKLIDDFEIRGFFPLIGTAGLISLATWLLPRVL